jgi:aryl carrier-like protein
MQQSRRKSNGIDVSVYLLHAFFYSLRIMAMVNVWQANIYNITFKMAVFWVEAPCRLVSAWHRPDDGGSKDLWNAGQLIPVYTALQPRRQPSS